MKYNASANTATLRFADDIDRLAGSNAEPSSFRLRIGTRETAPLPPVRSEAAATVISDFGTNGAAKIRLTARQVGENGNGVQVVVTQNNTNLPAVTANGRTITVELGRQNLTAQELLDLLRNNTASSNLVQAEFEPGSNPSAIVGNRNLAYSPLTLLGLGSTFDTATNLGVIGSSITAQTNLTLSSAIDPKDFDLDLIGASNDPGHRVLVQNLTTSFEDHVNRRFGADSTAGITTIYYNFRTTFSTDAAGAPLTNAITPEQRQRTREALSLWANYIGVQFVEHQTKV